MKVAVLGLGVMGEGMAAQLLAKGFEVAVWNRSAAKTAALGARGARVAATPADAAKGADAVVAMVADDNASRAVWLGPDGALAAMSPGAVAIDASTVTPGWITELAAEAAAREVMLVDAPVTGSKVQAHSGALRFLAGGSDQAVDRARPALDAMGSEVVRCGPTGSGALMKLINNFMSAVQVTTLAEALAMAEHSGLDVEVAAKVLTEGAPGSPIVKLISGRMLGRDYTPNFFLALMEKDLRYAVQTFAARGIDLQTAEAARQRFLTAIDAGLGDDDMSAVIEPLRS